MPIHTKTAYYVGLRIPGSAYSYADNYQVDSVLRRGTEVLMATLAVNVMHAIDALRLTSQVSNVHPVAWLKANDIATLSSMVYYVRGGYPRGKALQQAYIDHTIDWKSLVRAQRANEGGGRRGKGGPSQPPPLPYQQPQRPQNGGGA